MADGGTAAAQGPQWPQWSRVDETGLARYVTPRAATWLPLPLNRYDVSARPDHRRVLAQAIYDALVERDIRYDLEEYHPSSVLQTIRTPPDVVVGRREGTCLDLAALFCGLCLANELLPLLVVLEGHALAAVSLTHGVRDWNASRPGRHLFSDGPLADVGAVTTMVDGAMFLAVECTGFAHTDRPDAPEAAGRTAGVLSFDQAVAAGRARLDGSFLYAIDVAMAHFGWRVDPHPLEPLPGAWTTDIFHVLAGAPLTLSPHLRVLDFQQLVDERTRDFVGRDFLFGAIDQLIEDPEFPSGYILIRGEPGIGKTALLSRLVKDRGYIHHFNIAPQNIRSARAFLENVCAQLIVRYQLDHRTLPPEASTNSACFAQLLSEAATKAEGEPVVVLVDALDEVDDVGVSDGMNRLLLPPVLPPNVFVVLTSREQIDYRLVVDRREDLYLRDDDPKNLEDVRTYISGFLRRHDAVMGARIAGWQLTEDDFVDLLTEKSQGNFMYLVHVLPDIRRGRLSAETVDDVQSLPTGLKAYYERHWRAMRAADVERFERIYEPVLRILATVREPVPVSAVEEWTQVPRRQILDVVREWRPFLNETAAPTDRSRLYRIYHASFQDFLAEEGMGLQPFHTRIALTAISKIPGFQEGLDSAR